MGKKDLEGFFEKYLVKTSLFINKKVLQSSHFPENLVHREKEIDQIARILAPCLRLEKPSNLFIYGKTGSGKTATIKFTTSQMLNVAFKRELPLKIFYVNCKLKKIADTEYRLIAQLINQLGKQVPPTGLPTDEVYNIFYTTIDSKKQLILLILDEIDQLVKKTGDEILYNLTRVNSELKNAQLSIVGISNDLVFTNNLDPRVKSSLSEEEMFFNPYNAVQLKNILNERAKEAFHEGVLTEGVLEKCSALAARDHGDARRSLELLRVAGEIAERNDQKSIILENIDEAEEKIEKDKFCDIIQTQPKQFQMVLFSIMLFENKNKKETFTGDIYDSYKSLCVKNKIRSLTQRRVSDIISELDMLGIIQTKTISKGRYGRTRNISLSLPKDSLINIHKLLAESLIY